MLSMVPSKIASIMVASRRTRAVSRGPASSCQIFVTREGMMSNTAAVAGGIATLSTPMATVGRPMPTTPLSKPAAMKVLATKTVKNRVSVMARWR